MSSYHLIVSIVPRNSGSELSKAAAEAGAGGGTIFMGRGTASNSILQMLGFGDSSKDVVMVLTDAAKTVEIQNAMIRSVEERRQPFGILFQTDVSKFIKNGLVAGEYDSMNEQTTHQLITVIVNHGYAEDAMAAARKAGAGGGTIINARGTARDGDEQFFGMEIVPEKDMILILAETEKADAILEAIRTLPFLEQPGSGIAFCSPAAAFTVLGSKK
ncbi:MAG: transcriptional regulator [Treponemataceae bacterium]|nr:transcriptional regulator [Treponemataceae bacterium]